MEKQLATPLKQHKNQTSVTKVGVILNNISANQLAFYTINSINEWLSENTFNDATIFYENLTSPCIRPQCSIMCIDEIWSFEGILISTTISNTITSLKAINNSKRVFFVNDLEWTRHHLQNNYLYNMQAFHNNIKILTRSITHAKALSNYINRNVDGISPKLDIKYILDLL